MSPDKFADRLAPETYQDDDEVVGVFENDPSAEDSLWLSARLFGRLVAIASGYELHTLPMLGGAGAVQLNDLRCESLLDELAFVAERVDDPLVTSTAQLIADYVGERLRCPNWKGNVTFEAE